MRTHIIALATVAGLASPAFAQSGQTSQPPAQGRGVQQNLQDQGARGAQATGQSGMQSGMQATSASQFMMKAMQSDAFEMQTSRLAAERAQSPAIKTYAQKMIGDHGRTTAALSKMKGDTTASTGQQHAMPQLDAKHADMIKQLQAANGAAFDRLYAQQQVMAHQEAVTLFTAYSQNGSDQNLRSFASETLPTLQGHLRDAQALMSQMR